MKLTTKSMEQAGFEFWDHTLEESAKMELTNFDTEYNECGGYFTAEKPSGEEFVVCYHQTSDEIYDIATELRQFIAKGST